MGTINTVFFKVFLRESYREPRLTPEGMLEYLKGNFWFTFFVSPWSGQTTPDSFALQFGLKGYPQSITDAIFGWDDYLDEEEEIFRKIYAEQMEAIWVRWLYDDGIESFDEIYHVDCVGKSESRPCRYGYDLVRVVWYEQQHHSDDNNDTVLEVFFSGSYLARNSRWISDDPQIPTLTTPVCRTRPTSWDDFLADYQIMLPPMLHFLHTTIDEYDYIAEIQFLWQGRMVLCLRHIPCKQRGIRQSLKWKPFFLDDWDNCIDEEWLIWNGKEDLANFATK